VGSAGWVPGEVAEELARSYERLHAATPDKDKYKEFYTAMGKVKRREQWESTVWERLYEGNEKMGQISCIKMREIKYRPSPKWMVECLVKLGIHRELYTSAIYITPMMLEHHSRYPEDAVLGLMTGGAGTSELYKGGTCCWINTTCKEMGSRCMETQKAIKELNKANVIARHVAIILCDRVASRRITSNGGKILATWPANRVKLYEKQWRTEVPQEGRQWKANSNPAKQEIVMAIWQTSAAEHGMRISEEFWKDLNRRSREATGGYPIITAMWGPVYGREEKETETGGVPHTKRINQAAWEELDTLEQDFPYIFWSGRVGKLKSLVLKETEKLKEVPTGRMKVKMRLAGQEFEEEKNLKMYKQEADTYRKVKQNAAARRKQLMEVTEAIEKEIIEGLKRMLELHWELAGDRLVQEGKWTEDERRRATSIMGAKDGMEEEEEERVDGRGAAPPPAPFRGAPVHCTWLLLKIKD
jgi:hypothetical protein